MLWKYLKCLHAVQSQGSVSRVLSIEEEEMVSTGREETWYLTFHLMWNDIYETVEIFIEKMT